MIIVFSEGGKTARMVAKYRSSVPVLVVTSNAELSRHCQVMFGLHTMLLDEPVSSVKDMKSAVNNALLCGRDKGLCVSGKEVVVLFSSNVTTEKSGKVAQRQVYITACPGQLVLSKLGSMIPSSNVEAHSQAKTLSLRSTVIDLPMLFESSTPVRKTKVLASLGPVSNNKEMIGKLIDAGMDVARFNLAMTDMAEIKGTIELVRQVRSLVDCTHVHTICLQSALGF
jgi:pyruvate kinase